MMTNNKGQELAVNIEDSESGYLYIVMLSNGMMKVGRSRFSPGARISAHESTAKLIKATIVDREVFPTIRHKIDEKCLINRLSELDGVTQTGREWFEGVSFDKAREIVISVIEAESHEASPISEEKIKRKMQLREDALRSFDRMTKGKDISEHGHEWMSCYKFAKAIAKTITSNSGTPAFYAEKVLDSDLNNAELSLWILLYTSPAEGWFDYGIAAEDHPGDVLYSAEKAVHQMLRELEVGKNGTAGAWRECFGIDLPDLFPGAEAA